MGKPDPYGNWVIGRFRQETAGNPGPLPEEVIAAARVAWPRALAHAAREFGRDGSSRESEALAADIWEAVLRSVSKALQRKGEFASSVGDFESYLLAAFHHRFHRFQKIEHARREMFQSVSQSLDLGLIEGALDTEWVEELERAITIRANHKPHGWLDKEGLAGATIGIYMERDFIVVRRQRAASKNEVSIRIGENSPKYRSTA